MIQKKIIKKWIIDLEAKDAFYNNIYNLIDLLEHKELTTKLRTEISNDLWKYY